jgi:S-DNA-T family DNA segregation ATPase FtsK/SpoIIIE
LSDSSARSRAPIRFTAAVHRGLRESAFLALGVIAIVLFAALASYSPEDPGFSFTGDSSVVHNRVGPIGAWLADVLFFLFGRPAYLFPFMLVRCGAGR